jgi:hypothetical protein
MNVRTQTGALTARWSILMVLVTAILIAGATVLYARHVQAQFDCVARYNTALQQRSIILQRIAAEDRAQSIAAERNITRLIVDAIKADGDREKGQEAADRYLKASADINAKRAELDRQRAAQPFPQTPERACA